MRYKLLGRSGLRVSELCLGTMTFGEVWGWGASKEESHQIFDAFVAAGGNFIDTANDLGVLAWAPIAGGQLTGKYSRESSDPKRYRNSSLSEQKLAIIDAVASIARETGQTPARIAINWVRQRQQGNVMIPVIGARTAAQLRENLGCLEFALTPEQIHQLDEVSAIELGFPHDFLAGEEVIDLTYGKTYPLIDAHRKP